MFPFGCLLGCHSCPRGQGDSLYVWPVLHRCHCLGTTWSIVEDQKTTAALLQMSQAFTNNGSCSMCAAQTGHSHFCPAWRSHSFSACQYPQIPSATPTSSSRLIGSRRCRKPLSSWPPTFPQHPQQLSSSGSYLVQHLWRSYQGQTDDASFSAPNLLCMVQLWDPLGGWGSVTWQFDFTKLAVGCGLFVSQFRSTWEHIKSSRYR